MLKNIFITALLLGMFMMGPIYLPAPVSPRERIVYFQNAMEQNRYRFRKRLRNHYLNS